MQTKEQKRPVGRPKQTSQGTVNVTITIPAEYRQLLRDLGGSRWITKKLREESTGNH